MRKTNQHPSFMEGLARHFLLATAILAMACTSSIAKDGYTVTGTVEGTEDGDSVFLCEMQGYFAMIPQDTVFIKNHQFQFTGSVDGAAIRFIVPYHKSQCLSTAMVVLENAPISVEIYADTAKQAKVVGGPTSVLFDEFSKGTEACYNGAEALYAIANDSTIPEAQRKDAMEKLNAAEAKAHKYAYDFIISHIPSPVSDLLLGYTQFTDEEMKTILDKMGAAPVQYQAYKYLKKEQEAQAATAIGQKYTDIEMKGVDGKPVHVSDYVSKNKYTLIDFWASWCGPCRKEMPNVVKAYDLYHKKGFEVVGVSLDNDKKAWVRALDQLHMPWPQMSDLKGWESAGAAAYNIKAIPSNALVDQNGIIIARDLREEELQTKLAELFK